MKVKKIFQKYKLTQRNGLNLENAIVALMNELQQEFDLISTKTPNPSEEKGSSNQLFDSFMMKQKDLGNEYTNDELNLIKEYHNYLKANGETPEVDNPVPSLDIFKQIYEHLKKCIPNEDYSTRHNDDIWLGIMKILKKYQNGRETDKVQPKRLCDKGRCNVCVNYCTLTGSDSNM